MVTGRGWVSCVVSVGYVARVLGGVLGVVRHGSSSMHSRVSGSRVGLSPPRFLAYRGCLVPSEQLILWGAPCAWVNAFGMAQTGLLSPRSVLFPWMGFGMLPHVGLPW